MTLHLPTLLFLCSGGLALSALAMTLYGRAQRVYRGHGGWVAAQWLLAAGLALHLLHDTVPATLPLAEALRLQWPIVMLAGLRRFYARHALRLPASADGLLFALAWLAWLATWAAQTEGAARAAAAAGAALVLHGYAAALLARLADWRTSSALRALVGALAAGAALQALCLGGAIAAGLDVPAHAEALRTASLLATAVTALLTAGIAMLLTHERSVAKLTAMHRKLRFLADIDVLTLVPNRRHFHELAVRALDGMAPGRATVMMFDIDHFKHVNDLLGHAVGDEALRQVARCVRDTLRTRDVAGRLGGDEFAVLLPDTNVSDAMGVAARIVARLADRQVAPRLAPLSLSFGVVQMTADETAADALRRADQALYEAKRQGRSRAVVACGEEAKPVFGESRPLGLNTG